MGPIKPYQVAFVVVLGMISAMGESASLFGAELKKARVGVFTPGLTLAGALEGMQEGLARLGYVEGKNATYIVDDTKGTDSDLPPRMAKLLSAKPDVIFAVTTEFAQVAKRATSTVPIVFAWVGDPVQVGLIDSYPYSRSNVTGVTVLSDSLSMKRLQVLLEIVPKARRLLVLVSANESVSVSSFKSFESPAQKFGLHLARHDVTDRAGIIKALEATPPGSVDAIFHMPSNLLRVNLDLLVHRARSDRIPFAVHDEGLLAKGALISYGANSRLIGIQAANLVQKILKGARPGDITVETPDSFFFAINETAAKQIGMRIPREILERADRLVH